jgi:hypothetical protein
LKGKIFISYRRATDAFGVQKVYELLVQAYGEDKVFLDRRSLEPGEDWLQSLDREVARATAVVMVFSAEWFGPNADGTRRIDDPKDMVRRELVAANQFGRAIIPVIVDGSSPLYGTQLPKGLEFIAKHQFLALEPRSEAFSSQQASLTRSIGRLQPGGAWGRRFFWQVTWMALGVTSFVAAWHALGGSATYSNSFARNAMALRSAFSQAAETPESPTVWQSLWQPALRSLWHPGPSSPGKPAANPDDMALIELSDLDRQALMGGGERFDPGLLEVVARTLHQASVAANSCGPDRPVAINFDIAPDPLRADGKATQALVQTLVGLASCRPLILSCPRSVVLKLNPGDDMQWMRQVRQAQQAASASVLFTQAAVDPRGLRHSRLRTEPGVVLADIGRRLQPMRAEDAGPQPNPVCTCPASIEEQEACGNAGDANHWDPFDLAVSGDQEARSLSHSLPAIKSLAAKRFVLIGAGYGAPAKIAVPGRNKGYGDNVGETHMQSYLLHGAMEHAPVKGGPLMVWWAAAFSWLLAAAVLAIGTWLDRNDGRFTQRVPAYLLAGALMLSVPLLSLALAARWPSWTWLLGLMALLGLLTVGRALLACFEVMLHGGIAWKSLAEQAADVQFDLDKRSAWLRLTGSLLGRAFMVACIAVAVAASLNT